jgi:hypothetical protein
LTTTVKNAQRLIAKLRTELNKIAFFQDETFLDVEKPVTVPIGEKATYVPSKDIKGNYKNQVIYGAGAGLDRLQADNRVMQLLAARVIDRGEARNQIDFINSPEDTARAVDLEQTQDILLQKFLTTADPNSILRLVALQATGLSFQEAIQKLDEEQQAAQAAPAAGEPGAEGAPVPGSPGAPGPQNPEMEGQALAAGGQPVQPQFAPPPSEQIFAGGTPL